MIKKIIKQIRKYDKIALFHHVKPDGDSISASYGLLLVIKEFFPDKKVVIVGQLAYIKKAFPFLDFRSDYFVETIDQDYLTIIGDTSLKSRVVFFDEWNKGDFKICFDHHQNSTNINPDLFWHEPNWGASAMQASLIALQLSKTLSEHAAFFLLIGILTDTANFVYTQADPLAPSIYSQLLNFVSHEKMNKLFTSFKLKTKDDIEIYKFLLNNIQFSTHIVYVKISYEQLNFFTNGLNVKSKINFISNIEHFPIWAFFIETKENSDFPWEVSLRSNGPNILEVAKSNNGGGHFRAAGAKLKNKEGINKIIFELNQLV